MATPIHANLITDKFPYNYSELSSTIVLDQGWEVNRKGKQTEDNSGLPQAYYMENVIPIARGFSSVAYTLMISAIPSLPVENPVVAAWEIRGNPAGLAILVATESLQYIYDANVGAWTELEILSYSPGETTVANVKGISYIYIAGAGIFTYDFMTQQLVAETVLGLDIGEISGIFSAGAVMGAWSQDNRIFWGSTLNPVDFVPSLSTGAGSTNVIAISSQVVTVLPIGADFIIYTVTNAVSGRQTGNIQFPFTFDEIEGSTGISYRYHVAYNSNAGIHITYSASGFQQVNVQEAQYIWTELSEGIAKGIRIELDPLMERPEITHVDKIDVRLQFASNRYVVVSLRDHNLSTTNTPYTEAHIFDSQLNRWGKLNADHVCILEYTIQVIEGLYTYDELDADFLNYDALDNAIPPLAYRDIDSNPQPAGAKPGSNFGLIGIDGRVHVMAPVQTANFRGDNEAIVASTPRLFLGKYKLVRGAGVILQGIKVNKLIGADIVAHGHGYDGSYVRAVDNFKLNPRQPGHWLKTIAADSISIEFNGSFVISDLVLEVESAGETQQFAVPPVKKFYSYINTVPYSYYVTDAMGSTGNLNSIGLYETYWIDYLGATSEILSGTLRDVLQTLVVYDIDKIAATSSILSGTLITTNINVGFTVYDIDKLASSSSLVSGTLIQTLFPVGYTVYDPEKISANSSIISGTLV